MDAGTDGTAGTTGTYVEFGDWPQSAKSGAVTIDTTKTKSMGGFTYYKGNDGYWYAKVGRNSTATYYKVEAIKWRVLTTNYNQTGNALLFAERILFGSKYSTNRLADPSLNLLSSCQARLAIIR